MRQQRYVAILIAVTCLFCMPVLCIGQVSQTETQFGLADTIPHAAFQPEVTEDGSAEFELQIEEESESPYDEPIETDRHDFTQSSRTVGRGVLQLEYGFLYANKNDGPERENSYGTPELQIRYGLTDRVEFQIRWNYGFKFIDDEDDLDSAEDIRMDFKFETADQRGWCPESAVELRFTAPTGGSDFSTGRVEAGADYIYTWHITEYLALAGSTGVGTNSYGDFAFIDPSTNPDDHYLAWSQSVALGAKLTSQSTAYFEWFGIASHGRDEEFNVSFLNFGVDYLLNPNTVLDVRLGWGLTEQSDDIFVGVGGGYRF